MAHDFLGTHNSSQFARFSTFANAQIQDCAGRAMHLTAELIRVGSIAFTYDAGGTPQTYVASPSTSYIGRLLAVYEILGGNPMYDLNLRSTSQPVFLLPGNETTPAQLLSNGEVMASPGLIDAPSAVLMQTAKAWIPDVLKYKREYLERKIRRLIDYSEQLSAEIQLLTTTADGNAASSASQIVPGSLADTLNQLTQLMADPTYRATYNDGGNDPLGKKTYTPYAAYSGGPTRPPLATWGRDTGGTVAPGQGFIPTSNSPAAPAPTSANPSATPGGGTGTP